MTTPLIIYRSIFGATKQYAQWIRDLTGGDMIEFFQYKSKKYVGHNPIIICSGTYAGHMPLVRFISHHWSSLKSKRVIVLAVGAADPDSPDSQASYHNIPPEIRGKVMYFKVPGKFFNQLPQSGVLKTNLEPLLKALSR